MKRRYTYKPDLGDKRDFYFEPKLVGIPELVDMRHNMPAIEDQGNLGSCTANAGVALAEYLDFRNDRHYMHRSRLFVYYNERVLEGTVNIDSGAYIRDAIKALVKWGACTETLWPYVISRYKQKPSTACYKAAALKQAIKYMRVNQTQDDMCNALVQGYPIEFGFTVYESFESDAVASTGMVPMPDVYNEYVLGGHACVIVGYDLNKRLWICRNSWGKKWGDKGYFYMPFDYLLDGDLSEDFWIIEEFENIKLTA